MKKKKEGNVSSSSNIHSKESFSRKSEKKKRKKTIYRKRLCLHTMTFEEQILHVQDTMTPMIRKTGIHSMNLDIVTEEDFLPSTTTEFKDLNDITQDLRFKF
jgi:hypothetical protein